MKLTPIQQQIADLLLVGGDARVVGDRLRITPDNVAQHLEAMREALMVDTHSAMMAELRRLTRKPDMAVLEDCRKSPRQWCDVLGVVRDEPVRDSETTPNRWGYRFGQPLRITRGRLAGEVLPYAGSCSARQLYVKRNGRRASVSINYVEAV